ncbi:MAG TPA: hypothetical protein PKC19_17350, partial [Roseiflexaceae bacterium]|nr:hypothetical protein [Roseiflexaceae bacterium]
ATINLTAQPRRYTILVAARHINWRSNIVAFRSPTFRHADDERELGIVLFETIFRATRPATWLPPVQVVLSGLTALALAVALRRMGAGHERLLLVALFVAISLVMRQSDLRFSQRWEALLLTGGIAAAAICCCLLRPAHQLAAPARRQLRHHEWAIIGLFALLAALPLHQIWLRPGGLVLGPAGDNFEYIWKMAWFVEALGERRSPTFVPHFYAPNGFELANSELTPANTLLGLPLTLLFGPVAAYNLLIYFSYLLAAIFAFLLARRLGAPLPGALVGAIGLAFCLFHFQHSMSQITIVSSTQWIILAFYGWEGFLQQRRIRDALITAIGITLAAWSSWYYGPTLVLVLALYAPLRLAPRDLATLAAAWRPLIALGLTLAALVLPYAHPYLQLSAVGATRHPIANIVPFSAEPIDLLEPSVYHIVWGEYFLRNPIGGPERVGFGLSLLLLALIGLWQQRRQRRAWCLAVIAMAATIISFGPLLAIGDLQIPMPAMLINLHVPVLQSIRVWARMVYFAQIAVAMLAALAFIGYTGWSHRRRAVMLLLAIGVVFELLNRAPWVTTTDPRGVDRWLAQQPVAGSLVQVPDILAGYNEYYTLFSRRPLLLGYGTFVPSGSQLTVADMHTFPSQRALRTMRRLGVAYLVVARDKLDIERPEWRSAINQLGGLQLVYEDAGHTLYRVE